MTRAAETLGISRHTFHRAIREGLPEALPGQNGAVHEPFDDQQFPFIRTLWPAEPDVAWVEEYRAWVVDTVVPRAAAEGTLIVALDNFSQWTGLPPLSAIATLKAGVDAVKPVVAPYHAGIIMYAPNVPLAGWMVPIVNLAPVGVKFAATAESISGFAASFFTKAEISVPEELSLD